MRIEGQRPIQVTRVPVRNCTLGDPKPLELALIASRDTLSSADLKDPELLTAILEAADDAIIICEVAGAKSRKPKIVFANQSYMQLHGLNHAEVLGHAPNLLKGSSISRHKLSRINARLKEGHLVTEEVLSHRKDGSTFWSEVRIRPLLCNDGKLTHWVAVQRDITVHKLAIENLARKARELVETQSLAKIGTWRWVVGEDGMDCSSELAAMLGLGHSPRYVTFETMKGAVDPKDFEIIRAKLEEVALFEKGADIEFAIINRSKSTRTVWAKASPERTDDGKVTAVTGVCQDITERLNVEQSMRWNATHDRLTSLLNIEGLHERAPSVFATAQANGTKVLLALIDIDHLKLVNDTLGHAVGDALIMEAATRLQSALGKNGHVARLGGDEFIFLAPCTQSLERLGTRLKEVVELLKQPFDYFGHQLDCTASIGVTVASSHDSDLETLMRNADMAMYRAKETERGSFCFYSQDIQMALDQRVSHQNLAKLVVGAGLIVPFFQPQYSFIDSRIAGYEALLRIQSGEKILPPEELMHAFANVDLAIRLGNEMFRKVLEQMRAWRQQGHDFQSVAINVSGAELLTKGYAQRVLDTLSYAEVPPSQIEIEVTEGVLLGRGATRVTDALNALRSAGVRVSLDDFGTGYASFTHLKSLPVNRIKIDKSFVRNILNDREDAAIVRATIELAHALSMDVVAEGVETMEQAEFLRGCGCDFGQGFLFGRPAPSNEIAAASMSHRDAVSRFNKRVSAA